MKQNAMVERTTPRRHDNRSLTTAIESLIRNLLVRPATDRPFLAMIQNLVTMAAGDHPHAAILLRHIVESTPASDQIERLNREVGGILMIRFLHPSRRLHEALAAVELDVRPDQRFDDIENLIALRVSQKHGVIFSATIQLSNGPDSAFGRAGFKFDVVIGEVRSLAFRDFKGPAIQRFGLLRREQFLRNNVAFVPVSLRQ